MMSMNKTTPIEKRTTPFEKVLFLKNHRETSRSNSEWPMWSQKIFWKSTWSRQKSGGPLIRHFWIFLQSDWFRACTTWYISKPHGPLLFFRYLKWKFCCLKWSFHQWDDVIRSGPPDYHHQHRYLQLQNKQIKTSYQINWSVTLTILMFIYKKWLKCHELAAWLTRCLLPFLRLILLY